MALVLESQAQFPDTLLIFLGCWNISSRIKSGWDVTSNDLAQRILRKSEWCWDWHVCVEVDFSFTFIHTNKNITVEKKLTDSCGKTAITTKKKKGHFSQCSSLWYVFKGGQASHLKCSVWFSKLVRLLNKRGVFLASRCGFKWGWNCPSMIIFLQWHRSGVHETLTWSLIMFWRSRDETLEVNKVLFSDTLTVCLSPSALPDVWVLCFCTVFPAVAAVRPLWVCTAPRSCPPPAGCGLACARS